MSRDNIHGDAAPRRSREGLGSRAKPREEAKKREREPSFGGFRPGFLDSQLKPEQK